MLSHSVRGPTPAHLLAACFHDSLAIHPEDGEYIFVALDCGDANKRAEEKGNSTVIVNFAFLLPVSAG